MVLRFVRCRGCGMPHETGVTVCPVTGLATGAPAPAGSVAAVDARIATLDDGDDCPTTRGGSTGKSLAKARRDAPLIGAVLADRYVLDRLLARGGMGVVYEGLDRLLGRRVAVKVLAARAAGDPLASARFREEARILSSLGHRHIVAVYESGTTDDGAPWLAMEKLEGEPLSSRLRREKELPITDAIEVARQVLSALAATHARAVLHRDLKPENVFLAGTGAIDVRVLDFGVAKVLGSERPDADASWTRAGFVVGTPAYMAYEQARGSKDLDARTDLYALGVVLYEMLTGRLPWVAKAPAALVVEMQTRAPMAVRAIRPEVPSWLDRAVTRLLSRDRAARYADAETALAAMVPAHDDEPTMMSKGTTAMFRAMRKKAP